MLFLSVTAIVGYVHCQTKIINGSLALLSVVINTMDDKFYLEHIGKTFN